jgi:SAM-dependent methyltransferase
MKTDRKNEWFDDDSFWHDLYSFMFSEERFVEAVEQVDKVLKLAKPEGKSVLDLCCGPGRCAIALARRGFLITGVDRTKYLLDKAKEKVSAEKVKIEWVLQDMRDFIRRDSFDLILSMFTSFGYFDEKHEDVTVFENMFTNLRPGGSYLIDIFGKELLAATRQPTKSYVLPDSSKLVQCHEIFDNWARIRNE